MILLAGHRAAGKSTVCQIFQNEGFWVFETGPFWRNLRDLVAPNMNVGEFHFRMREYTNDPEWENNFLAGVIRNQYELGMKYRKDLIISGYRSFGGSQFLTEKLKGYVFPHCPISVLYIESDREIAFERFKGREGENVTAEQLASKYKEEVQRGLYVFRDKADFILDNSGSREDLTRAVREIACIQLSSPCLTFEGKVFCGKERG